MTAFLIEDEHELGDRLNRQLAMVEEWRKMLFDFLQSKLSDEESEATGQEYMRDLEMQDKTDILVEQYPRLLAERKSALTGHAVASGKESRPRNQHEAILQYERQQVRPERQVSMQEIVSRLRDIRDNPDAPHPEKVLAAAEHARLSKRTRAQITAVEELEREFAEQRRLFNRRIEYYRRLQELSDQVTRSEISQVHDRKNFDKEMEHLELSTLRSWASKDTLSTCISRQNSRKNKTA